MEDKRKTLIEKTEKTTCLYFHINMDKLEVFYVGIGDNKRPYTKSKWHRTKFWFNITNKYNYQVIIIEKNLTWEEACEKEVYWIKTIGRRDLKKGTLVNLTDGGNGVPNSRINLGRKSTRLINLMDKKFGKLTVVNRAENDSRGQAWWFCECGCGKKDFKTSSYRLIKGYVKSCGCFKNDYAENDIGKPILQKEKSTGKILSVFKSIKAASNITGIELYNYINNRDTHGGGYDWEIIPKEDYGLYKEYQNISIYKFIRGKTSKKKITAIFPDKKVQEFKSLAEAGKVLKITWRYISSLLKQNKFHKGTGIKFKLTS